MLASLLYVPEIKRGKKREKKHYILSIQCWVPSHITIQHVCMIQNGAQCWVCMTNTDTKILEFRLQCSTYNHLPQCILVYHLPCNAYLFGDAYSQLVGKLLYNCIKDMFITDSREKVIKKPLKEYVLYLLCG